MPHVGRILILVRTDDDRVGGKVREVETEGEGSLAELLDQPGLDVSISGTVAKSGKRNLGFVADF